jgi:hypothetical protein
MPIRLRIEKSIPLSSSMKILMKKKLSMLKSSTVIQLKCCLILSCLVLSCETKSTKMAFPGPLMYLYFDKCLTDNALEELHSVTLLQDDQTIENFQSSQEKKENCLLPYFPAMLLSLRRNG